jgi:hypothetical protein
VETYVVQIWNQSDKEASSSGDLRGYVEHVDSGRRSPFRDSGELLAFFETQVMTVESEERQLPGGATGAEGSG